ncbi:MAG TPA: hypothetical protein VED59_04460 [Acidimicrobiales bacterium]|nr:hypothetical protein [Acidimicrobiales bacterium]
MANEPLAEDGNLRRPAFYAASPGMWKDWWTLLHPPYTAWHLSYVVIGACLAPQVKLINLLATLLAFFAAVGVAAHALDELNGRPLRTSVPSFMLVIAATAGLGLAVGLGVGGVYRVGLVLVPFLVVGPLLVVGYNLELGRGMLHNDIGFGATWGAFPVLVAYVGQTGSLSLPTAMAAAGAMAMSMAQRSLSSPARVLRRQVAVVQGQAQFHDGRVVKLDEAWLLAPLERALKAASWAVVLISASLAVARLT